MYSAPLPPGHTRPRSHRQSQSGTRRTHHAHAAVEASVCDSGAPAGHQAMPAMPSLCQLFRRHGDMRMGNWGEGEGAKGPRWDHPGKLRSLTGQLATTCKNRS
ncbi:hypothetical protein GQ53DRAFT_423942 [Thozetella sp. PMI_491]|nr:hypothetical protein GQ53DRAFT_423942 [Thozetella sp. PMI_491]